MKKTWILLLLLFAFPCLAGECDFIRHNVCHSCDDPHSFVVGSAEACSFLCPGRVVNFEGSGSGISQINCALEKCPSEYPFQSSCGGCYKTQKEAKSNYNCKDEDVEFDDLPPLSEIATVEPIEGKCPEGYAMTSGSTSCRFCADLQDWSVSKEECNRCPARVYKEYKKWEVTQCEYVCPEKNQFKRWDGKCLPCNYPKSVRVETHCNIEEDCDDICPNRTIIKSIGGNVPSVLNCPAEKPMMDDEGVCYSCDAPIAIGVQWNPDFCHRFCPNQRHLRNGVFCVLNEKNIS